MNRVGSDGQTLTVTEFAELTGVSRERLRTWERRYGFPTPHRVGAGARRYALGDVARVVAVRQAAAHDVPLPEAIARARAAPAPEPPGPRTLAGVVEQLPVPVVVLSGPAPMRIEYANAALRRLPGAPAVGAELVRAAPAFAGSPCENALQRLFATDAAPVEAHHPAWGGHTRHMARSALFRLAGEPGDPPLVAMLGLEGDGERAARAALAAQRRELDALRHSQSRWAQWLDAVAQMADALQREPDSEAAIETSLEVLVRQADAVDAALARHECGRLIIDGSHRGRLARAAATVAAHPELARALRDGEPSWLEPAAAAALGVPERLHACAVPVAVAGDPLGVLLILAGDVQPLDADRRRALRAFAGTLGFALLRDRLVGELRAASAGA
ncbi:MAG TPA: MerR family transcriptional regulator [Solirubrobacteraceae bacterium]|nr:MerR family transcriptional regulator [Solirubrobacteraceae bacterium]